MPDIDAEKAHQPVLLDESLALLQLQNGGFFVDATCGLGGHSEAMLDASPDTRVIGIDQDADALKLAKKRLARFGKRAMLFQANFAGIGKIVGKAKQGGPDGILADLGVSSLQLDSESRGFSFRFDAPLDMRMDAETGGETVADLLATIGREEP